MVRAKNRKPQDTARGQILRIDEGYLYGWALLDEQAATAQDSNPGAVVEVGIGNTVIATARANLPLAAEFDPPAGKENLGFAVSIGGHHLNEIDLLWARIANTAHYLPRAKECVLKDRALPAPTQHTKGQPSTATRAAARVGIAQYQGGLRIWGWVIPSPNDHVSMVHAMGEGKILASAVADAPPHPARHPQTTPLARTFSLTLPMDLADGRAHEVRVIDGHGAAVGSPVTVIAVMPALKDWVAQLGLAEEHTETLHALADHWQRVCPNSLGFESLRTWFESFGTPKALSPKQAPAITLAYGPDDTLHEMGPIDSKRHYFFHPKDFAPTPFAAALIGNALAQSKGSCLAYGDSILIDETGQWHARFHGAWDRLYAAAKPGLLRAFGIRGDALRGMAQHRIADLPWVVLAASSHDHKGHSPAFGHQAIGPAKHLPWVLGFEPARAQCLPSQSVFEAFLENQVRASAAAPLGSLTTPSDTLALRFKAPRSWPAVTVVIPTRDRVALIKKCLQGLADTDYPGLKVLIVDNGSRDPQTVRFLRNASSETVSVIEWNHPFNYAAINNYGVAQVNSALICLLNDDIEIIDPQWMKHMASQLQHDSTGVVGAKLIWPNDMVQHAGVLLGQSGLANHIGTLWHRDDPGYEGIAHITRQVSAVTAACLMMRTADFRAVGGFDEKALPVAFNDVDLCLKVQAALGKRVVLCAQAQLIHHESASRGADDSPMKQARAAREMEQLRSRWREQLDADPFYSPCLNLDGPSHAGLAFGPRRRPFDREVANPPNPQR